MKYSKENGKIRVFNTEDYFNLTIIHGSWYEYVDKDPMLPNCEIAIIVEDYECADEMHDMALAYCGFCTNGTFLVLVRLEFIIIVHDKKLIDVRKNTILHDI